MKTICAKCKSAPKLPYGSYCNDCKNWYVRQSRKKTIKTSRDKVREAVTRRIAQGEIKRLLCSVCGSQKSEAHHVDYAKPFLVKWLCRKCHQKEHGIQSELPPNERICKCGRAVRRSHQGTCNLCHAEYMRRYKGKVFADNKNRVCSLCKKNNRDTDNQRYCKECHRQYQVRWRATHKYVKIT